MGRVRTLCVVPATSCKRLRVLVRHFGRNKGVKWKFNVRPGLFRGKYDGEEGPRLDMLWRAVQLGAPAIDIELAACDRFLSGGQTVPESTTLIMSQHNFTFTPSFEELKETEEEMREKGADVAKLAVTAQDVADAWTMIRLLEQRTGGPCHRQQSCLMFTSVPTHA